MSTEQFNVLLDQINNTLLEDSPQTGLDVLEDIEKKLLSKRSRLLNLPDEHKSALLNITIPETREVLEKKLNKILARTHSNGGKKSSNNNKKTNKLDDFSYLNYDYDEDDEDEHDDRPTWEDLNPDNLPYASWLVEIGLPRFFPFNEPLLYKIAAIVALINSAAIPGKKGGLETQAELPMVIAYGLPLLGKSTFCRWIGNHYEVDDDPDYNAFQECKENDSAKGLRDAMDRACNLGDGLIREACLHADDFEPKFLLSDRIWAREKGLFIAVQRSQAVSKLSANGKRADVEMQTRFTYWLLKLLSSNNHPKELFNALPKMQRRSIVLPFEILAKDSDLGKYRWSVVREEYMQLWNKKDRDNKFWKGILRPLLKRSMAEFNMPPDVVARSTTLLAVGVYAGIFESLEEGEKLLSDYWEYTSQKLQEGYQDFFLNAVEDYVNELENNAVPRRTRTGRKTLFVEIWQDTILEKCSQGGNREQEKQRLASFMSLKGYTARSVFKGNRYVAIYDKSIDLIE